MAKRYRDAFAIQQGACNPIAIVNALKNAIDECRAENMGTDAINGDMAVRAMVHQLAHLTSVQYFDQTAYGAMMERVEKGKQAEIEWQRDESYMGARPAQPVITFGKKGVDVVPKRAPEVYQYMPQYAKIAIERIDADSDLRTHAKLDELLDAYAKTHGEQVDQHTRDSAHCICKRRFPDFKVQA
jgi:hypothetical protein